jgi:NAD(P)H dehydrogenase (quinone)
MLVVTGASGRLGRLVIDALAASTDPARVVAAVRTPARAADLAARGVVVRRLDYDDAGSISSALEGARRVLLISSTIGAGRIAQHQAVVDACARAGVELLAYTSLLHADASPMELAVDHRATEGAIRASGVPFTLLRNGWYTENYTENLAPALENGTILGAAGEARVAAATRADLARAAAAVLTNSGHEGATYELAGAAFTMAELAAAVSEAAGRPITYTDVPAEVYADLLTSFGVPAETVELLVDLDRAIPTGALDAPSDVLAGLIGRAPTPLADAVRDAIGMVSTTLRA